jgi:hypothetical protein
MKEPLNIQNSIKSEEDLLQKKSRKPTTLRLPLNSTRDPIAQTDDSIAAGTVILKHDEPELIVEQLFAPCLGNIDGMVEVIGDSMLPVFPNGSRIAISRLNNVQVLVWGRCYYLIDKNFQGALKMIHPADQGYLNSIKLVSTHPDQKLYPPFHRSWDELVAIFKIIACIIKQ